MCVWLWIYERVSHAIYCLKCNSFFNIFVKTLSKKIARLQTRLVQEFDYIDTLKKAYEKIDIQYLFELGVLLPETSVHSERNSW